MLAPDPHSLSRPHEVRVTHVGLDLAVDFVERIIRGTATLDLEVRPDLADPQLALDTRRLAIRRVTDEVGAPLPHALAVDDPLLGARLTVGLPRGVRRVVIDYATAPDAEALQWLSPEQTAGGAHPFLFTQGHAIQTRSWIPLQDSPGVRVTYDARIVVPSPLVALMSAQRIPETEGGEPPGAGSDCVHRFVMSEPIPAYLIALAVGDLASRTIGPRTAVFAEPCLLERAAYELAELEGMVEAAEALLGPYHWGRFDVVVMPPSFPYGGMENPRLTFASPSLLAGDRSLTTVIVHELAHAWAGNLVTNATWNDFWINEGTTVYLELRLNEALWGEPRAAMLMSSGFHDLVAEIKRMGGAAPDTRLHYDMTGRDPAEGVTVVPYLKGAAFFWTLERVAGRERLDAWLRSWFARQAFCSVTTATLLADLREHLFSPGPEIAAQIDLDRWMNDPGVPEGGAPPPSALIAGIDAAAGAVLAGETFASESATSWTPQAWRHFLGKLLAGRPEGRVIAALEATFALSESRNTEVLTPWLRLRVQTEDDAAIGRVESFLAEQGRTKYLRPLYADLLASEWGAPVARRAYAKSRPRYHALVRAGLDRLFAAHP